MARPKKCKKCELPFSREEHKVGDYNIIIDRCKCGWTLVDVLDRSGASLKPMLGKKVIEQMLKSHASHIKL